MALHPINRRIRLNLGDDDLICVLESYLDSGWVL
jgi:hypothetical protein